jgi:hypothetical protein
VFDFKLDKDRMKNGEHTRLFDFIKRYFSAATVLGGSYQTKLPPLYFQHQGHSRTIIGYEIGATKDWILLFDPSIRVKRYVPGKVELGSKLARPTKWFPLSRYAGEVLME